MFLVLSAELFDIGKQQKSLYSTHYQLIKKSYFLLYQNSCFCVFSCFHNQNPHSCAIFAKTFAYMDFFS